MFRVAFHMLDSGIDSDGIHAIVTYRRVTVVDPGRSRRRIEGGTGIDAGAEYRSPPCPLAGGERWGYGAHDTLF